ncbi:hypothetical protein [Ralstonia pseudosolanacearum]|uniref:hypothetical protein n=2 Tax=Ralstonia pseudosolanacearum TaxID=1310165 RepID=UPI0011602A4D|nr:hypothetical protein [Ralstonia pseudosolanacearum]QWF60349.1 hypothetical protein KM864_14395 [Ralstonia solanacearum]TXD90672.1 hypothetical protein FUT89_12330 [Ralstonia pseudosolanacearum]
MIDFVYLEKMTREDELRKILERHRKGDILDGRSIDYNPFFALLEYDGRRLCSMVTNGEVFFNLVDSWERNSVAIYKLRTVAVFRGVLEAIFSISAKIVGNGIYPQVGGVNPPEFRPESKKLLLTKRDLLNSLSLFECDDEKYPWMNSVERQALFLFISNTLFRFVVFHELGHLYHEHGKRSVDGDFIENDSMDREDLQGGIDSQARESIADTFAFQKLAEFQQFHLLSQQDDPIGSLLSSHFMSTAEDLLVFVSQMAFIYFYMMESPTWAHENPVKWTHPPAQFRLQTIFAALLEHGLLGVSKERMPVILQKALMSGPSITAVMFDTPPEFDWLQILDQPRYREHYELIYAAIPNWLTPNEDRWGKE